MRNTTLSQRGNDCMKNLFSGLITAFSMYSIIPMPQTEWNKNSMKYAMCFFPIVGGFIGMLVYYWCVVAINWKLNLLLSAVILVLLPILISGGIHMDGFIDTSDALYSRREMEKKLEILKDPHVGAFGVIMCVSYLILMLGLGGQLFENAKFIAIVAISYPLSRAISGLSIVTFKTAKNTGLAHIFSDNADKKVVKIWLSIVVILMLALIFDLSFVLGAVITAASVIWFLLYKRTCYKQFGGITGDLAGYFVQTFELLILLIATIGGLVL